ncbi:hypothetical protein BDY19DRAFT_463119 [Irpex rosettiformis]|uniref:Uncharacterized protein n=1 Tax=Irpex rosettiformis TaxID=378272 RepID=A0ACB8TSP4_9APHY|nr:hypothetical protein BDY19DRAFT_463119 [Irpex rosettiformis]
MIQDQDLRNAAAAWPNLEKLKFSFETRSSTSTEKSRISLLGVQALYNGCPELQEIDTPVTGRLPTIDDSGRIVLDFSAIDNISRKSPMRELHLSFILFGNFGSYRPDVTEILALSVRFMFPLLEVFFPQAGLRCPFDWGKHVKKYWGYISHMDRSEIYMLLDQAWTSLT